MQPSVDQNLWGSCRKSDDWYLIAESLFQISRQVQQQFVLQQSSGPNARAPSLVQFVDFILGSGDDAGSGAPPIYPGLLAAWATVLQTKSRVQGSDYEESLEVIYRLIR